MKIKSLKNDKLISYLHYCIALAIVLICTMTACKKHEPVHHEPQHNRATITSISPTSISEEKRSTVIITGTNFSSNINDNEVNLGSNNVVFRSRYTAKVTGASTNSLTVELLVHPDNNNKQDLTIKEIWISTPEGNGYPFKFTTTVVEPRIFAISPTLGTAGDEIVFDVHGENFGSNIDNVTIQIGGVIISTFTNHLDSYLTGKITLPNVTKETIYYPKITVNGETSRENHSFTVHLKK